MIEKMVDRILVVITDPFMLFSLLVIFGMFYLLLQRERNMKDLFIAIREQSAGIAECNKAINGMIPLIEVLVYGKGGKRL